MTLAESAPPLRRLPSSRGLGHQIFILATRVRISLGVPNNGSYRVYKKTRSPDRVFLLPVLLFVLARSPSRGRGRARYPSDVLRIEHFLQTQAAGGCLLCADGIHLAV
jgi:hypothetical protein